MNWVIVTGASGSLGQHFTRALIAAGYGVIGTGRDHARLADTFADLAKGTFHPCECDLAADDAAQVLAASLEALGIEPYALINNARNLDHLKTPSGGTISRQDFLGELTLGVVGPYELSKRLQESHPETFRRVVNIGSQYGQVAVNPNLYEDRQGVPPLNYGTAKAALNHLTKELAVAFAPSGATVNSLALGGVRGRADEEFQRRYGKMVPLGRMLEPEECSGALLYLLSDGASATTGQTLVVDGGWSVW